MERRINQSVADSNNQNILSSSSPLSGITFSLITGGNTEGFLQANFFRSTLPDISSRYMTVVERDSNQISTLADTFVTLDQNIANQME